MSDRAVTLIRGAESIPMAWVSPRLAVPLRSVNAVDVAHPRTVGGPFVVTAVHPWTRTVTPDGKIQIEAVP